MSKLISRVIWSYDDEGVRDILDMQRGTPKQLAELLAKQDYKKDVELKIYSRVEIIDTDCRKVRGVTKEFGESRKVFDTKETENV